MPWTCPECGRVLSDAEEETFRLMMALGARVSDEPSDPDVCGACRWRYEPMMVLTFLALPPTFGRGG